MKEIIITIKDTCSVSERRINIFPQEDQELLSLTGECDISPFICYDLRFPVWSRNRNDYDLAIYAASWPEPRINVWNTLLKARAIENQCYVAGSNRIGIDGNNVCHNGMSQIINPRGELIISAGTDEERVISAELSIEELIEFRVKI